MSQHNIKQFTNFTKAQIDAGLSLHRLPVDTPSQLADAFRAGADWGAQQSQDAKRLDFMEYHGVDWGGLGAYFYERGTYHGKTLRDCVDAAMLAEGNKQ